MVYTESGKISEIKNILKFNKDMNKFTYGVAINEVIDRKNQTPEDYDKFYRFSNPEKFKNRMGEYVGITLLMRQIIFISIFLI